MSLGRDGATEAVAENGARAALVVVGVGIQWAGQTTLAARRAIERADVVLCAVAEGGAAHWLRTLHDRAESFTYPRDGRARGEIYRTMVARVLAALESGNRVCAAFYGSPAVLTWPAHEALRAARRRGFVACMLPGVSFLECLFADLDVDPGEGGCSVFEAEQLLRSRRAIDPHGHLVLAQLAAIGQRGAADVEKTSRIGQALMLLTRKLTETYPPTQRVVVYEAAADPVARFRADFLPLIELPRVHISESSTLYVPPVGPAPTDEVMCDLLRELQATSDPTHASNAEGAKR